MISDAGGSCISVPRFVVAPSTPSVLGCDERTVLAVRCIAGFVAVVAVAVALHSVAVGRMSVNDAVCWRIRRNISGIGRIETAILDPSANRISCSAIASFC